MKDRVDELSRAFERFPGIGPRQARRFVYHLLAVTESDRSRIADLIKNLSVDVKQCAECMRFWSGSGTVCNYCSETAARDDSILMVVEKDQDLLAVERANAYRGRYFVLGGVLTLSGKGAIRERELVARVEARMKETTIEGAPTKAALREVVLALSATSEGEHTADRIREILTPLREHLKLTVLGRGLSTGTELEYSDAETLSGALQNRKET
jgi:recombination protein RecR